MTRARILAVLAVIVVLAAAGAGGAYVWFVRTVTQPGPLAAPATVIIAPGTGLSFIARQLTEAGVSPAPWMVALEARRTGRDRTLKPGEYLFEPGVSIAGALDKIVRHDVVPHFVTIPEGLVTGEIHEILEKAEGLIGKTDVVINEGDLLPETYRYEWGDSRNGLIARMGDARDKALDALWAARATDLPLRSPEEAVILASIVEKETGVTGERARVAAVFINRLRRGMKLQSDPTVIYGLVIGDDDHDHDHGGARSSDLGRPLLTTDLERASPYNTYMIDALPPAPICHPGRAALEAVLNPATSQELYFVADGSGGHAFAETLEQHNRNVAQWRRIQRQNQGR